MTKDLTKVWSSQGISVPVTTSKYTEGWVVEIPTFENFNYVLKGIDEALLGNAETGFAEWNPLIDYKKNSSVHSTERTYWARKDITGNASNVLPKDDDSNWSAAPYYGGDPSTYYQDPLSWNRPDQSFHSSKLGFMVDSLVGDQTTPINTWSQSGITVKAQAACLAFRNNGVVGTSLITKKGNDLYISHIQSAVPNGAVFNTDSTSGGYNTYKIIHEGNLPSGITGVVPSTPSSIVERDIQGNGSFKTVKLDSMAENNNPSYVVTSSDAFGTLEKTAVSDLGNGSGVPPGTVVAYSSPNAPPVGWLRCWGYSLSKLNYPGLYSIIGDEFGETSTTFKIPDLRGMFVRGHSANISLSDPGRSFGSYQADGIKNHRHVYSRPKAIIRNTNIVFYNSGGNTVGLITYGETYNTGDNTGGGAETRPRNIALQYIIKT